MKKALLFAGAAVITLLAVAAVYVSRLNVDRFRPQIQAELQRQLGRQVALGAMGVRIFPLSIRINDVTVAEDPSFRTDRPFASAREVSVAVSLFPLLRKEVHVQSFVLRDPVIELVQNRSGKWNFSSLGAGGGGEGGGLSVAELRIENGRISVSELADRKPASVYDHIGIRLADFGPGKVFRLNASAQLPGAGKDVLILEARGDPAHAQGALLAGQVQIQQAPISALRSFLHTGATKADGSLSTAMDFELQNSALKANGWVELANLRTGGADLGRPIRLDCKISHNLDTGVLKASEVTARIGNAPVVISGELDTRASRIDATIRTAGAGLKEVLTAASAFGISGISGTGQLTLDARIRGPLDRIAELECTGRASIRDATLSVPALTKPLQVRSADLDFAGRSAGFENLSCSLGSSTLRGNVMVRNPASPEAEFNFDIDRLDLAELRQLTATNQPSRSEGGRSSGSFTAKGSVHVGTIAYNQMVLKDVRSECVLSRGILTLSPLTAELFGGRQSGSITVNLQSQPPTVALKTNLDGVDANQLLSTTTSLKNMLYGLLAAKGDAAMQLSSGGDAARTLNGNLNIQLSKGKLGGINLMNQMASLGKFVGFARNSEPFTDIVQLSGDIQVRNGVADTNNLLIQTEGASVSSAGTFSLVDQSLNLRLTAVLDRDASQKAGGSRVGGFLTTALVNGKGELVIPAIVTGTFANPRFAPDAARIAEMKLKNLMPSTANPGSMTSGIVGILTGKSGGERPAQGTTTSQQENVEPAQAPGAKPPEAPQRKGVLGILDSLRKKASEPAKKNP
ncbi:MAG TPA: AsmA family protein [Bryobacteraceae bacterium]|nr:AsmA family protein [Bryobacteraceae bacterium]